MLVRYSFFKQGGAQEGASEDIEGRRPVLGPLGRHARALAGGG